MGRIKPDIRNAMFILDPNKDGVLTKEEYRFITLKKSTPNEEQQLKKLQSIQDGQPQSIETMVQKQGVLRYFEGCNSTGNGSGAEEGICENFPNFSIRRKREIIANIDDYGIFHLAKSNDPAFKQALQETKGDGSYITKIIKEKFQERVEIDFPDSQGGTVKKFGNIDLFYTTDLMFIANHRALLKRSDLERLKQKQQITSEELPQGDGYSILNYKKQGVPISRFIATLLLTEEACYTDYHQTTVANNFPSDELRGFVESQFPKSKGFVTVSIKIQNSLPYVTIYSTMTGSFHFLELKQEEKKLSPPVPGVPV